MNRWPFVFVVIVTLLPCTSLALAEGSNLIDNSGFEKTEKREGGQVVPALWSFPVMDNSDIHVKATLNSSNASPKSGKLCLAMNQSEAARSIAAIELTLPKEEAWYELTAWVRTDGKNDTRALVDVIGWSIKNDVRTDAGGIDWLKWVERRSKSDEIYPSREWKQIKHVFNVKPTDDASRKTLVRLIGWVESGPIFWDDISLHRIEMKNVERREPSVLPTIKDRPELSRPSPTIPGKVFIERPTHLSIGLQWPVQGDVNRNGIVEIKYRKVGDTEWKPAMPMLRIRQEVVDQAELPSHPSYVSPNMHAGSLLNLEPGTEYEVQLDLKDPDGGSTTQVVRTATRALPKEFAGGRKLHVYPADFSGSKEKPAFEGLRTAYAQARPGDIILVHAGSYVIPQSEEVNHCAYVLDKKGTLDKPIVIRAAGDGDAIFSGASNTMFDLTGGDYNWVDGLIFRESNCHILSRGSTGLIVTRCRIEKGSYGIRGIERMCRDFTISDNVIIGDIDPNDKSYGDTHAVWLAGQGHAVFNNLVHDWWDGIDITGYFPPEDPSLQNCSIDFYRNQLYNFNDDCIELDFGSHNIRAFENLCYSSHTGITCQPVYGGPAYIYRNVVFNTDEPAFKFNNWPAGLLVFHNTLLSGFSSSSMWQNSQVMNNLMLGAREGRNGGMFSGTPTPETSRLDYNGYPDQGMLYIIYRPYVNDTTGYANLTFETLDKLTEATGYEKHGVGGLDYGIFVNADRAWFASLKVFQPVDVSHFDVRLKDGNKAVDAGVVLPTINDGFSGKAPDLGAYEVGSEPIHYGPRNSAGEAAE